MKLTKIWLLIVAAEDIEAGPRKKKIDAEPTLPVYLKVTTYLLARRNDKYLILKIVFLSMLIYLSLLP